MGDGRSINIWEHQWLPEPGRGKIVTPRVDVSVEKVSDLFYPNTTEWNIELLETSFYPWEVETIRRIYVSKLHQVDCLVWPLSPDGSYTVKTAYHMLASEVLHSSPSSSSGVAGNVCKRIWKIKTPQKIKHFIWRAAKDSLPTKHNLVRRQIPVDKTCSFCDDHQETILHVLWLCDHAKAVWKSCFYFAQLY